jgi:hypothetical protein
VKRFVYLNQFLKERDSAEPKIVVQEGKKLKYVNEVRLSGYVVLKTGELQEAPEHDVHAWIEVPSTTQLFTS